MTEPLERIKGSTLGCLLLEYSNRSKFTARQFYASLFEDIMNRDSNIPQSSITTSTYPLLLVRQIQNYCKYSKTVSLEFQEIKLHQDILYVYIGNCVTGSRNIVFHFNLIKNIYCMYVTLKSKITRSQMIDSYPKRELNPVSKIKKYQYIEYLDRKITYQQLFIWLYVSPDRFYTILDSFDLELSILIIFINDINLCSNRNMEEQLYPFLRVILTGFCKKYLEPIFKTNVIDSRIYILLENIKNAISYLNIDSILDGLRLYNAMIKINYYIKKLASNHNIDYLFVAHKCSYILLTIFDKISTKNGMCDLYQCCLSYKYFYVQPKVLPMKQQYFHLIFKKLYNKHVRITNKLILLTNNHLYNLDYDINHYRLEINNITQYTKLVKQFNKKYKLWFFMAKINKKLKYKYTINYRINSILINIILKLLIDSPLDFSNKLSERRFTTLVQLIKSYWILSNIRYYDTNNYKHPSMSSFRHKHKQLFTDITNFCKLMNIKKDIKLVTHRISTNLLTLNYYSRIFHTDSIFVNQFLAIFTTIKSDTFLTNSIHRISLGHHMIRMPYPIKINIYNPFYCLFEQIGNKIPYHIIYKSIIPFLPITPSMVKSICNTKQFALIYSRSFLDFHTNQQLISLRELYSDDYSITEHSCCIWELINKDSDEKLILLLDCEFEEVH